MLVGCAGSSLAEEFGRELRLQHCTLTFVAQSDMPRWGQLGCQGFIILDGSGGVVCKSTPAFMEVEQLSFRFVETVLASLLSSRPLPSVCPGVMVQISGLVSTPELNGSVGMCVQAEGSNGRCGVSLGSKRGIVSVKTANLSVSGASQQLLPSQGGGCCGGGCGNCDSNDGEDGGCEDGSCDKAGCPKPKKARNGSGSDAEVDAAISRLQEATASLREPGQPLPARMVSALQKREASAKAELEALVQTVMHDLDPAQLQAAASAIASAMASIEEMKPPATVQKREAFVNGLSIGVCKNDQCLCADCECGASCQCNIGGNSGVEQAGTCEPCGAFRAAKAAAAPVEAH